jgi:hypothetical protein
MDLEQSVRYIFDDEDWVKKLGILLGVTIGAGLLMPLLFAGLVLVAASIGWSLELIRNVRDGVEYPLPDWEDFGKKISVGVSPMVAGVVYFLPLFVIMCVLFLPAALAGGASEDMAAVFAGGASCLVMPVAILYVIAASLLYTMGLIRYSETEKMNVFFQVSSLTDMLSHDRSLTGRYILYLIIVQAVGGVINSTGLGGLVTAALLPPVIGHLTGQFAAGLDGKPKGKPKRTE